MIPLLTLSGIDQAISNLNFSNTNALKSRLVDFIRQLYTDENSIESVGHIDTDELIKILWDTDGDQNAIKSRRKNFNSVKSSLNADLKKLYQQGKNPEGIMIGPDNTFVMSEEAKDKILEKYGFDIEPGGSVSLEQMMKMLQMVSETLSGSTAATDKDTADISNQLNQLKNLLEGLSQKINLIASVTTKDQKFDPSADADRPEVQKAFAAYSPEVVDDLSDDELVEKFERTDDLSEQGNVDTSKQTDTADDLQQTSENRNDFTVNDASDTIRQDAGLSVGAELPDADPSVAFEAYDELESFEEEDAVEELEELIDDLEDTPNLAPDEFVKETENKEDSSDADAIEAHGLDFDPTVTDEMPETANVSGPEDLADGNARAEEDFVEEIKTPDALIDNEVLEDLAEIDDFAEDELVQKIKEPDDLTDAEVLEDLAEIDDLTEDELVEEVEEADDLNDNEVLENPEEIDDLNEYELVEEIKAPDDLADKAVLEDLAEIDDLTEDELADEIKAPEDLADDAVLEDLAEIDDLTEDELVEEVEEAEDLNDNEVLEDPAEVEDLIEDELVEEIAEMDDLAAEVAAADLDAVDDLADQVVADDPEEFDDLEEEEVVQEVDGFEEDLAALEGDEMGLPADSLGQDDLSDTADKVNKARLLAEEFDGYLGAMDRYFNQYLLIPEGDYIFGRTQPRSKEEFVQTVRLAAFYMGRFPVTNGLFEIFVEKTGYKTLAEKVGYGTVYYGRFQKKKDESTGLFTSTWNVCLHCETVEGACWYQPSGPGSTLYNKRAHPVVQIAIEDAMAFAAWTGKRLPTEEEWEAAARTQNGRLYPWGPEWQNDACNFEASGVGDTTPVDNYAAFENDLGIADTMGNVMEWTLGHFETVSDHDNRSNYYVAKGGSWISGNDVTLLNRFQLEPESHSNILGFRCVAF